MNRANEHHVANIINFRHMKKLILILLVITLLFGCEKKNEIEIIPDYDRNYYPFNMVEISAKWIGKPTPLPFQKIIKEIHKKENPNEDVLYPIYLRYYINENGKVDKIKILRNNLDVITRRNPNPKYEEKIYTNIEKIVKKALPKIAEYEFTPAKTNGKVYKSRADIKVIYLGRRNGEVVPDIEKMKREQAKSDFDDPVEGIFFVSVEEMPSPIGGIKAIQNSIVYPELAKRAGIEGRVYVKAYIDSTGVVVKTELIRGIGGGCDEVAMDAVKKVRFTPGRQRGKPMNVQVTVPILFKLGDGTESIKKPKAIDEVLLKRSVKDVNQNGMAKISGKIISQNGVPLVAANILLEGTKKGCSSNTMGEFSISKIEPGEYKILVNSSVYGKRYLGKIKLKPNKLSIIELRISEKRN